MFAEKSKSFDLQRHQMRSSFSRDSDKCSSKNNCKFNFIQSRITSYFHAMILFVSKSIKCEAFSATHVSMKQSIRTSSFMFRFIFRFVSMRFFFQEFLVRLLFADIVKNVSSFIDLLIESCQVSQKSKIMKYS